MIVVIEQFLIHSFLLFQSVFTHMVQSVVYLTSSPHTQQQPTPLWGLPVYEKLSSAEKEVAYETSQLTAVHESFVKDLMNGFEEEAPETQFDCTNEYFEHESIMVNDDEWLSMDAWEEAPEPIEFHESLPLHASAQIADYEIGEQVWIVQVVGEEQGYLHVSDGSGRAWVNAERFGAIGKGDYLSMLVERVDVNHVHALQIDMIQQHSNEFSLSDDYELQEYEQTEHYLEAV